MERTKRRAVAVVPAWVWGLVAVGVVLCGGFVVAVGAAVAMSGANPAQVQSKRYTREEFKQLVVGKDEAEVIGLLGRPGYTGETSEFSTWHYDKVSTDPISGKVDYTTTLWFYRGKVTKVTF